MLNGIELEYTQQELIKIVFSVASSEATSADLLQWILLHQK